MRGNEVRARLLAGGTAIGLMCFEFATPAMARIAAAAGAEFILFDQEHSGFGTETMRGVLAAASPIPSFVRPPDSTRASVSGTLDLGATGLMLPMVESAEQARQIVSYARYPPAGSRGVKAYLPDEVDPDGLPATLGHANRETLLIAQVETSAGLDHVDEIAATDGIDVLFIGHFDLTTSLGTPGAFYSPEHAAAVDRILAAAAAAGKPVGSLANDLDDARRLLAMGFHMLVLGDLAVFQAALQGAIAALRA